MFTVSVDPFCNPIPVALAIAIVQARLQDVKENRYPPGESWLLLGLPIEQEKERVRLHLRYRDIRTRAWEDYRHIWQVLHYLDGEKLFLARGTPFEKYQTLQHSLKHRLVHEFQRIRAPLIIKKQAPRRSERLQNRNAQKE